MIKKIVAVFSVVACLSLTACANNDMNTYSSYDVGRESTVDFGTILQMREVKVQGENSGTGSIIGGTTGGLAGSALGNGGGQVVGVIGGILVGAIAGGVAEQEVKNRKGIEYTITKADGKTVTIVQNVGKDDEPLHKGERVMIQTRGSYRRVLPAESLPTEVKKPKDIETVQ